MNSYQEKQAVYEQMKLLLKEINRLSSIYEEWKCYLLSTHSDEVINSKISKIDIENLKYLDGQMNNKIRKQNSYSDIATKISSLLKESDTPLSTKQIHVYLTEKCKISISYSNLSCNVLKRINEDKNINVERSYRGYWQYRQKNNFY